MFGGVKGESVRSDLGVYTLLETAELLLTFNFRGAGCFFPFPFLGGKSVTSSIPLLYSD